MRKQFTFYRSYFEAIRALPTHKQQLQAYTVLCDYGLYKKEPDWDSLSPLVASLFTITKPVMDQAHRQSENIKNRAAKKRNNCEC